MNDPTAPEERPGWIGVDFARLTSAPPTRTFVPLVVIALLAALGVASLRIDLIRTRYALAANLEEEQRLTETRRALLVRLRGLRDPATLAALAEARGFRPADHVLSVADPMPSAAEALPFERLAAIADLPNVSAGPPPSAPVPPASTVASLPAAELGAEVPR